MGLDELELIPRLLISSTSFPESGSAITPPAPSKMAAPAHIQISIKNSIILN